jgi:hypothetical protein
MVAEQILEREAEPRGGILRRHIPVVAFPFKPPIAKRIEDGGGDE